MRKFLISTCMVLSTCVAVPALSQTAAGTMSAVDAGTQPMAGTSSQNYVAWAADSDQYEIQSSKLALTKSKDPKIKSMAREMIDDHMTTTKSLLAALPKTNPKVPKPGMVLSSDNAALIAQLKQASTTDFDGLYLQQQKQAHQKAWALHKGYSTDGTDPALKQVAASAVPIIEKHIQHLKTMTGGGSGM